MNMDPHTYAYTDVTDHYPASAAVGDTQCQLASSGIAPLRSGYDTAINAESRTYWDGDELVSLLSVHTLICPLIRAELRGRRDVRVLVYYHASTRLGLHAFEAVLQDNPGAWERLGLDGFVQHTLRLPGDDVRASLHDPAIREMYLHEVIRYLSPAIVASCLQTDDLFTVSHLV